MLFLELTVTFDYLGDNKYHTNNLKTTFKAHQREIFGTLGRKVFLDVYSSSYFDSNSSRLRFVIISKEEVNPDVIIQALLPYYDEYRLAFRNLIQTTAKAAFSGLNMYDGDLDDMLDAVGISSIVGVPRTTDFWNELLVNTQSNKGFSSNCLFYGKAFQDEIQRIEKHQHTGTEETKVIHYAIESTGSLDAVERLVAALHTAKRLQTTRVAFYDASVSSRFGGTDNLEAMCMMSVGGTVVFTFPKQINSGGFSMQNDMETTVKSMAGLFGKYRNRVQFIFILSEENFEDNLREYFPSEMFIKFQAKHLDATEALDYLKVKALEDGAEEMDSLAALVSDKEAQYEGQSLIQAYSKWQTLQMVNEFYPEYQEVFEREITPTHVIKNKSAYERLQELIGIKETKEMVLESINLLKAQQIRLKRGIDSERPNMHMVFAGNPGTGKSTVARLLAEILKDEGILPRGELIDGSRENLVGRYVGHTAPLVKAAFKRARGSVLLIDEAYSFVDSTNGGYGSEAVATIVKEMENLRGEMIVIFAGYKGPMEEFINSNEGLRSRVARFIDFPDYDGNEMLEITDLIIKEKNYRITPKTRQFLLDFYQNIKVDAASGNARLARNVVESGIIKWGTRMSKENSEKVSTNKLKTLIIADFIPVTEKFKMAQENSQENFIGFKK